MTRLPPDVIGDAYTSDHVWNTLTELVEVGNRMAGQTGEREGARVMADAFEAVGLRDVTLEEFDVDGWWRGSASLDVGAPHDHAFDREHEIIALPGTTAGDVEAEMVDLGYGLPEDVGPEVDGRIVVVRSDTPDDYGRWVHRLEKYVAVVEQGAAGFVFRNHVPGTLPPTGEIGWGGRPTPIPAVGVSSELGARLVRYTDEGTGRQGDSNGTPTARLSVECRTEPSTSANVEGVLGPDTEQEVLVTAHVDAHDIAEGASDNGVGSALVAEIGRLLARVESDLETGVRFVTFGAEEIGLCGAHHFAATRDPESIKCVLNVDGAGASRTPSVRTYGFDSLVAAIADVTADLDVPLETREIVTPYTDAWAFAERGVPAVTVGSKSAESGRGWGHTHADTLDKLDGRDLRDLAIVYASVAAELAAADRQIPHESPETVRDSVDEYTERQLRFFDRWSFE